MVITYNEIWFKAFTNKQGSGRQNPLVEKSLIHMASLVHAPPSFVSFFFFFLLLTSLFVINFFLISDISICLNWRLFSLFVMNYSISLCGKKGKNREVVAVQEAPHKMVFAGIYSTINFLEQGSRWPFYSPILSTFFKKTLYSFLLFSYFHCLTIFSTV